MSDVVLISCIFASIACFSFIVSYLPFRFEDTREGRNMMITSISVMTVMFSVAVEWDFTFAAASLLLAGGMFERVRMLHNAQKLISGRETPAQSSVSHG